MSQNSYPNEFAAQLTESLTARLHAELVRLNAPANTIELLIGLEFFALYQTGRHRDAMDKDVPSVLQSSLNALAETGGL